MRRSHLADFVEEQRAAVGALEQADAIAVGAREAAADVAEQLGFEQRLRNPDAVDRHQRQVRARG